MDSLPQPRLLLTTSWEQKAECLLIHIHLTWSRAPPNTPLVPTPPPCQLREISLLKPLSSLKAYQHQALQPHWSQNGMSRERYEAINLTYWGYLIISAMDQMAP